jgi:PAS domain S-box-containing protein
MIGSEGISTIDLETPLAIQLQATLGRIELVLGAIDEAIVWTDEYGSIRWSNKTFDQLVNRSRFEILGARLLDLLPLAQDNQILTSAAHPLSLALRNRLNTTEIYQFQQAERTLILEISATYLELPAKERSITLVIRDITERKQAEIALQESQQMLQLVIDNVPQSIFWKDKNSVFQGCNLHFAQSVGADSPKDIVGKTDRGLSCKPEEADFFRECDRRVMQRDISEYHIIEPLLLPDGTQAWLDTSKVPLHNAEGNVVGILGIFEDITERKQAEVEIINALKKEKELNELKSRFISMASHEFRTPLSAILSSAELLEYYGYKWTEAEKCDLLHQIQTSANHITQMLEDVLLIGQAEAGKLKFNLVPLDLERFCWDLIREIQIGTDSRHSFVFVPHQHRTPVYLDKKLLRLILINLFSNAAKYSLDGSTIRVNLICRQKEVVFRVEDKGIGIAQEDQPQLFEAFYRGSNVSTVSGTGLGLAIVKRAVELHHGSIAVESELGAGSAFIVKIPFVNPGSADADNFSY